LHFSRVRARVVSRRQVDYRLPQRVVAALLGWGLYATVIRHLVLLGVGLRWLKPPARTAWVAVVARTQTETNRPDG